MNSMDITRTLFSAVESERVFIRFSPANDLRQFLKIAQEISEVRGLRAYAATIQTEQEHQTKLAFRLSELLIERHPVEYAHPCDHAIAIYLDVLRELRSPYTLGLAAIIYTNPQLFWGRKVAHEALVGEVFPVV